MINKNLYFKYIVFIGLFFSNLSQYSIILCKQTSDVDKTVNSEIEKVAKELDGADQKKQLEKLEAKKEEYSSDQPLKMAEKLPAGYKERVLKCWENCQHLMVVLQHPILFLYEISRDLLVKLNELKQNGSSSELDLFEDSLKKVQNFFNNQSLQVALQYGMVNETVKKELDDISVVLNQAALKIEESQKEIFAGNKDDFKARLLVLQTSFDALKNDKNSELMKCKRDYLDPEINNTLAYFDEVKSEIDDFAKGLTEQDPEDLRKAVTFWQEIFRQLLVLKQLNEVSQTSISTQLFNLFEKSSPYLLGGYAFYRKITEMYSREYPDVFSFSWNNLSQPKKLGFLLGDQALRMSMIPIHFLSKFSRMSKEGLNPFAIHMFLYEMLAVYSDPNFLIMNHNWPMRSFYRVGPAFAYTHILKLYDYVFEKNEPLSQYFQKEKIWHSDNVNLKRSVWFSFRDGYRSLSSFAESEIYQHAGRDNIKKIENNTLGLVKPDLLRFILDTSMPILAYKYCPSGIAALDRKDVFSKEYLWEGITDWNYVGRTDIENISDEEFIEGRILGYFAINLGSHFGKAITAKFKEPVKGALGSGCSAFANGLVKLGVVPQGAISGLGAMKEDIKDILTFFAMDDFDDPSIILGRKVFFVFLVNFGILTEQESKEIESDIENHRLEEEQISLLIDKIFTTIADNIVIGIGGFVGSACAWVGTDYAMKKYGPFYPKLKQAFDSYIA